LACYHTVQGKHVYSGDRRTTGDDGKPIRNGKNKLTTATVGRLQLKRTGTDLFFLAAEGLDDPPVLIHQAPVGREDVRLLWLSGTTNNAPAALDVRLLDLRIRAGRIGAVASDKKEDSAEKDSDTGPRPGSRRSLLLVAVVVLVGMLAGAALLLLRRWTSRAQQAPAPAQPKAAAPKPAASPRATTQARKPNAP
jgi:hypothetical protein